MGVLGEGVRKVNGLGGGRDIGISIWDMFCLFLVRVEDGLWF